MAELWTEWELAGLLSAPEGQLLERKSARIHPRDLATTLVAFANADGGRLLIGVEDDGTVTGLDATAGREQVERLLRSAYEFCTPSVQIDGVSPMTAYRDLGLLVQRGLLKTTGTGRSVRYVPTGVVR